MEKRWESGTPHHPYSEDLAKIIYALDDSGEYKFGGDGDNGETLLYYADVLFEYLNQNDEFIRRLVNGK